MEAPIQDSDLPRIKFFSDRVSYKIKDQRKIILWLKHFAQCEDKILRDVNIILTSDSDLLEINRRFLNHDYYTDIITFQNEEGILSGEIYISIDRVKENSNQNRDGLLNELHRVIIHGMLHMAGYLDKSDADKQLMRDREKFYLNLRNF